MNTENIYDVSKYSDKELYELLDVNNPTDRELEAKILQCIAKYENSENPQVEKMHTLFEDIYHHFFSSETSDEEEEPIVENMATLSSSSNETPNTISGQLLTNESSANKDLIPKGSANDRPTYVSNYEFGPSNLNPILKETLTRIIFIDSQYRDYTLYPSSSDFQFDLSEPLTKAVTMKLHSFSVPYTWYNISNMYNSNYFVFEGNVTAIRSIKIPILIKAGIYDEPKLLNALNQALVTAQTNDPNVNFGTSQLLYSSVELKIQFTIDLQYSYNGNVYYAKDFKLMCYNTNINKENRNEPYSFHYAERNTTLGWIMGYHSYSVYDLSPTSDIVNDLIHTNDYTYDATTEIITLTGNTALDLNTTKTLYLSLDDYTSNRINDGLITVGTKDNKMRPHGQTDPSLISQNNDGSLNASTFSSNPGQYNTSATTASTNLTLYENQQVIQNKNMYSVPPQIKDDFAIIPLKLSGLKPGALFAEFGGGLMENNRIYFGPVHLKKMRVQLYNDKGQLLELNGGNWNFSLSIQSLYNYNRK